MSNLKKRRIFLSNTTVVVRFFLFFYIFCFGKWTQLSANEIMGVFIVYSMEEGLFFPFQQNYKWFVDHHSIGVFSIIYPLIFSVVFLSSVSRSHLLHQNAKTNNNIRATAYKQLTVDTKRRGEQVGACCLSHQNNYHSLSIQMQELLILEEVWESMEKITRNQKNGLN